MATRVRFVSPPRSETPNGGAAHMPPLPRRLGVGAGGFARAQAHHAAPPPQWSHGAGAPVSAAVAGVAGSAAATPFAAHRQRMLQPPQHPSLFPSTPAAATHGRAPPPSALFQAGGGSGVAAAAAAAQQQSQQSATHVASGLTATVEARERTVTICGVAPANRDALLALLSRHCGRVASVQQVRPMTLAVRFDVAASAAAALSLDRALTVNGQRFVVMGGAPPAAPQPSAEAAAAGTTAAAETTAADANAKQQVVSSIRRVRFPALLALPFADRWLLPLLLDDAPPAAAAGQKRQRDN